MVRRSTLLLPTLGCVLALGLSGCGSSQPSPAQTSSATSAASARLDAVKISGGGATKPTITLPEKPFPVPAGEVRVVKPGEGQEVNTDNAAVVKYVIVNGATGGELDAKWDKTAPLDVNDTKLNASVRKALTGAKPGAQVLATAVASDLFGPTPDPKFTIAATDSVVFFFQVESTKRIPKQAEGKKESPVPGAPTVEFPQNLTDPAKIQVPAGAKPPTSTVVHTLITGPGPKVTKGQTVKVTYTGVTWRDPAKPFDYSAKHPPGTFEFTVGGGQVIKAWEKGVEGHSVGSRLLLLVPPADGYGTAGRLPDIKGDDTLIFVIDILDAA